jgi:hypothetical protein
LKRRKFGGREIVAMTLKYLTKKSEVKDIHVQFGSVHTSYTMYVELGMTAVVQVLIGHQHNKLQCDGSDEGLRLVAEITKDFVGLAGCVVGMMDGLKLETLQPPDCLKQNHDYNW